MRTFVWDYGGTMPTALVLSGGGPLAVAWECGLVAGLARAGLARNSMDFILGTSAGAIVGAQLAAGRNPEEMTNARPAVNSPLE